MANTQKKSTKAKIPKKTTKLTKSKINNSKKIVKPTVKSKAKKPLAIPKGYNSITPYLLVENGIKAIEFYKKALGAKEVMRMDKPGGEIAHAELKIGDSKIMLANKCEQMPLAPGSAISIHLYVKNVDTVIKNALAAGATLIRPIEDAFYGDRIGLIQDPFGNMWSVATHIEDVSLAQMKKRAAAHMSK